MILCVTSDISRFTDIDDCTQIARFGNRNDRALFGFGTIDFDLDFFSHAYLVVVPTYRRVTTHSRLSLTHAYEGSCQLDIKKDSTDGLCVVHGSSENPQ